MSHKFSTKPRHLSYLKQNKYYWPSYASKDSPLAKGSNVPYEVEIRSVISRVKSALRDLNRPLPSKDLLDKAIDEALQLESDFIMTPIVLAEFSAFDRSSSSLRFYSRRIYESLETRTIVLLGLAMR
jgi:hypothetical protein